MRPWGCFVFCFCVKGQWNEYKGRRALEGTLPDGLSTNWAS